MRVWKQTKQWTKHNAEALVLIGLVLSVCSFGYAIYQKQVADQAQQADEQAQRILQSEVNAAFQALSAISHGGSAQIFQQQNGLYSDAFSESFQETMMNISASFQASVTCNNGITYNVTGPLSCPGESPNATDISSIPIFAAR